MGGRGGVGGMSEQVVGRGNESGEEDEGGGRGMAEWATVQVVLTQTKFQWAVFRYRTNCR